MCELFENREAQFFLPLDIKIKIPQDTQYVYLGTFEYTLDYELMPTNIKSYDEFDQAKKQIKRATGKDVDLIRVELESIE